MEWMDEPDREDFEYAGFKCLILRHPELLHLCGYVGLPKGHPYYGKYYDNIDIDVHGGLTFSGEGDGGRREKGYWWIGFDCGHCHDLVPGVPHIPIEGFQVYRNFQYVRREIEDLADQVATLEFIDWQFKWVWPLLLPLRTARGIWSKSKHISV